MSGQTDIMSGITDMNKEFLTVLKSLFFVAVAATAGAVLAILSVRFHMPTGWVGALALIIWSIWARKNWAHIQAQTGLEPSGPERVLRLRAAGTALLVGHMLAGLSHLGLDLHIGQGNYLAIDSWTMFAALLLAGIFFRHDEAIRDERDDSITARGTKAGYLSLIGMLILLLSLLGFLPVHTLENLDYFTLANILVAIILLSITIKYTMQLIGYAKDTEAALTMGLKND